MLTFFKTKKKIVFQEKTLDRIKAGNKKQKRYFIYNEKCVLLINYILIFSYIF